MHMVRHTTYAVHLALVIVGHPQHIGVELSLMGFWNGGYAFAGTHNNMVQCACITHVSSNVWQPFLLRMLRLSRPFGTHPISCSLSPHCATPKRRLYGVTEIPPHSGWPFDAVNLFPSPLFQRTLCVFCLLFILSSFCLLCGR